MPSAKRLRVNDVTAIANKKQLISRWFWD